MEFIEKNEFGNFALVCKVDAAVSAIALLIHKTISMMEFRVWVALVEIAAVQKLCKDTLQRIPSLTLEWIQELSGIKYTKSIKKALRALQKLGLFIEKKGRVILTEVLDNSIVKEFVKKASQEVLGWKRTLSRWLPIPRQFLKHLAKSTARTEHAVMFFSLIRSSSIDKYKGIKNTGTVKLVAIERLTKCCHTAVACAAKKFRELGFFQTERPERISKLRKHGLFIKINFSKKLKEKKEKAKDTNKVNCNEITDEQLSLWKPLIGIYRDFIRKKVLKHSEANLLNFFCAARQATMMHERGKTNTPVKLFVHIVRNGFHGISQEAEDYALSKLKKIRELNPEQFVF